MKKLISLTILAFILSGCVLFHPHKQEVERLHNGMSEEQVKEVMGEPLTLNIFADNRLSYVYTMQPGYGDMTLKRVICIFSNGRLVDIQRG
jgi:outer membrane protein assembly factor BamE